MPLKKSFVSPKDGLLDELPLSCYQYWYDIIASNDYDKGKDVLAKVSKEEKHRMVNLPFRYEDHDKVKMFLTNPRVRLMYPLHIAASYCHRDIVKLLMEFDVCVTTVDEYGCNLFHNIITASVSFHGEETVHHLGMIDWICQQLDKDVATSLLMQENTDGLRPVEFAAQQGQLVLMTDFLSCKGVYMVEEEKSGMAIYHFHDITEYELGGRIDKSPLSMLVYMDKSKLECPCTARLILDDSAILKQWIDKKLASNMPLVWMWFILRIAMIMCFFVIDSDSKWIKDLYANSTMIDLCEGLTLIQFPPMPYTLLCSIVLVYIFLTLSLDVVNYGWLRRNMFRIRGESVIGKKSLVTNIKFFTAIHEISLVFVAVALSIYLSYHHTGDTRSDKALYVLEIIRGLIPILLMWSFCYFLQMVPKMSKAIITMEGMLKDMFGFLVLYIIVVTPYVHIFETFVLVNNKDGCVHEFSNPLMSFYTMFRLMLNTVDLTSFESSVNHISVLYIMHMTFVFVVSIMMINFLIAAMATSASRIAKHETLLQRLNKLALVIALEDGLFWVPRKVLRKLKMLGFKTQGHERIYLISAVLQHQPLVMGMPDNPEGWGFFDKYVKKEN